MKLYALIPAFNEALTIRDVVQRTLREVSDVIVVDDGSTDGTAGLIKDLPVTVIPLERNLGKASALAAGFKHALSHGADAVITIDGDSQHCPEEIPLFVDAFQANPGHVIVGNRLWDRARVPIVRYCSNRVANFWISWASGVYLEDTQSGFRLYPRQLLETIDARHGPNHGFVFESEFLINAVRAGHGVSYVRITVHYPENHWQQTRFNHVRDISRITKMVAGKLIPRGMDPAALFRSLRARDRRP